MENKKVKVKRHLTMKTFYVIFTESLQFNDISGTRERKT